MYLKIIKVFIALFGLFLVSPIAKYQPDTLNTLHTEDSCAEAEAVTESETELQEYAGSPVESIILKTEPAETFTEIDVSECGDRIVAVVSEKKRTSEGTERSICEKVG